jgi:hypothetical protein
MPNIYQKLQQARVELQGLNLKKTGRNQNFSYYELGDILPAINEICKKHGLFTQFSIVKELGEEESAKLIITDADDPQYETDIYFQLPTAEVALPKGQAIQGLGAKTTYMRRYMLMVAFEIVESDTVDSIKQQVNTELKDTDIKQITEAKTFNELTKVCGKLKQTYKAEIITPFYNKRKKQLEGKKK